jgi:hypothetical protein
MQGLSLLERIVFGWLPREPSTISDSGEEFPKGRKGKLVSFFVFELLVVFISLEVLGFAGLGSYAGFTAGAIGAIAAGVGGSLYLRSKGELASKT